MQPLVPFNLSLWIAEHRDELKPPVGNRRLFRDSEFIVMVVGGPNTRKDFHLDPAEEFFFQLEGTMTLRTVEQGRIVNHRLGPGDIFLLPPNVPHSPVRPANTVGLVVERERRPGELDGFQWYCERCESLLYEEKFELTDIETQFPGLFARFYGNLQRRSCRHCGSVMEPPT
jgi:3-hydroxyanthranilate 3,4-dioxygenase